MKKAIGYIRISDKDQSNFSLIGQEQYIRDFAAKQDYEIIAFFKDNGQSAKNFDRPDWKLLQKFCKENQTEVDALIVAKYDRFSRNLREALNMIEMLEEKYNIRILSALEPILLNPNSPHFFQFRTQMLMGAQVEWLIIRDRTRSGINTATKSGRYITTAPFGYINQRDEKNKPIIVIEESKAAVVRRIYEMFLQGASLTEISLEARRNGYPNRGHSAIKFTITSPTYAGLIKVPAYNDEPEHLVKGIHQPIITEADWWKVQNILNQKNSINRTVMNEEVPLRAVLKCIHANPFTAGNSKGKRKYYWYYKNECCPKPNLSATKIHDQLEAMLQELSLPEHYIIYLQQIIEEKLTIEQSQNSNLVAEKIRELSGLQQRIDNVEEKYINDGLDAAAYNKWRTRYQQEIAIIKKYISDASKPMHEMIAFFKTNLPKLANLKNHYLLADLHTKQAILRTVFNSQLYYHDGCYRTPYILPVFALKAATLKEKRLLIIEQPLQNSPILQGCAPNLPPLEHLTPLLHLLNQVKTA